MRRRNIVARFRVIQIISCKMESARIAGRLCAKALLLRGQFGNGFAQLRVFRQDIFQCAYGVRRRMHQQFGKLNPDGGADPGARIGAFLGSEGAIIAFGDVIETDLVEI